MLQAFRIPSTCRKLTSGVRHGGVTRQGTKSDLAHAEHTRAHAVFQFVQGDVQLYGRILFMFELKLGFAQVNVLCWLKMCIHILGFGFRHHFLGEWQRFKF